MKKVRRLTLREKELLRKRAVRLVQEGFSQKQIVHDLGISRSALSGWVNAWRKDGESALFSRKHGRPEGTGKLSAEAMRLLFDTLCRITPDQCGLSHYVWNKKAIEEWIQQNTGISVTETTILLWMRKWGFAPQLPEPGVAIEYDDEISQCAVWRMTEYPRIKRLARKEKLSILLFQEVEIPRLSLVIQSVFNARGVFHFRVLPLLLTPKNRIDFFERLILEIKRPLFVLLNFHPNHANRIIRNWQRNNADSITLSYIPIKDLHHLPVECWPFRGK